jgi:hypothetical protein
MNIQLIISLLILGVAVFFITRKVFSKASGNGEHHGCDDCPPNKEVKKRRDARG